MIEKKIIQLLLSCLMVFSVSSCLFKQPVFDEKAWRKEVDGQNPDALRSPHFENGVYFNPWSTRKHGGLGRFLKWKLSQKQKYTEEEMGFLPKVIPGLKDRIMSYKQGDFITWIGHSTFLIRINNAYLLIDPIFSNRALLPKRKTPPAIKGAEIGEVAKELTVIISHNHYDHLDEDSIKDLPENTRIIVPMGLKGFIEGIGKRHVTELDWWQEIELKKNIRIVCLPAQHWSRRIGQDTNTTLWASYMIITPDIKIYYAADSGYFIGYREIGRMFPSIDYALIPTTAYHPRWFMHYAHMDIREAIDSFHDLGARYFIPTQWGTFWLGDEPPGYPVLELKRRIKDEGLDHSRFIIMDIGEIRPLLKTK